MKENIKSRIFNRNFLFKITNKADIICIFSTCYNDALIWREKEIGNAIYLHRIILNRVFKGEKIFKKVMEWAINHAQKNGLKYIRMDN